MHFIQWQFNSHSKRINENDDRDDQPQIEIHFNSALFNGFADSLFSILRKTLYFVRRFH